INYPTSLDETLAALLGGDDVFDIQPLSVDNSHLKAAEPRPSGANIFFGKKPKVCSNKPFKPPDIRTTLSKPTCSEPVKFKTQSMYMTKSEGAVEKRQFDRLRALNGNNILDPGRKLDDPLITKKTTDEEDNNQQGNE
ncbi:hypothetical protein RYX36_014555, partial [Vicia faba]